ncbi:hypothetical protein V2G26_002026 [Clonostachys chloroleuca]
MPRACDSCSVRKIKCNGRTPCQACVASSLPCSRLRARKKSGPKGPRKRTKEAIIEIQQTQRQGQNEQQPRDSSLGGPVSTLTSLSGHSTSSPAGESENNALDRRNIGHQPGRRISLSSFSRYLTIYHSDADDKVAYALAASICAATMAQLHLVDENEGCLYQSMIYEAEKTRFMLDYSKYQTTDALLTSFFLHVLYSNIGNITKSTLLLREAITYAHIMGIHQDIFYSDLHPDIAQHHLHIAWILFITDRAHALQHDIPSTFKPSPTLPELRPSQNSELGQAFCSLCRLFQSFDDVCPRDIRSEHNGLLGTISTQLRRTQAFPFCDNEVQRADIVVTDSWLRVVLWKAAIPYVDATTDPNDQSLSVSFPISVARDLLAKLTTLSSCALEAHGPGMMSKLFEVASSVADVIICAPNLADVGSVHVRPREILCALSSLITSLRTTGDPALLTLLREKMMACALIGPGQLMQITDISEDLESQEDSW